MTVLIGLVLMMSSTASAYPSRSYYSRPHNNYRYYQPEIDRMLGYYNPYYYMVAAPVQSRSLMSDDYYYQDPYQVSQLNDMFSDYILGQLSKSKGQNRQGVEMRTKANSKNGISRAGNSIPGAFLVPAKVNGAFAGPLAVVPAHYGGPGAVTNSAATGAQYLPIIDGPNWPFLGRPKVVSSFAVDPQSYSSAGGAPYVPVPDGPNWPYIGVASPIAESRSSRPKDYDQHLIDDESYFPNIDYPFNYYPDDEYLYGNY
ncbi:hypothetical protein DAPPUDRAFT_114114 [Daphnia pulex]|uniref:Uncharacterized protein n=1 Tax=Daphnia pulex TaxID=6669 RepID=E9HH30_DAPPU|nr:hypothetical protein DAPPUDRAFT_114114 [Daphnia pulex]|eukprot:EFX68954.1 hypothetical protein DAPPUDRAFT_114114 [Daphnia pulex]